MTIGLRSTKRCSVVDPHPPEIRWFEVIEAASDAVVVVDADRRIRYANAAVADLLGYRPDQLVGEDYELLVPEPLRARHAGHHAAFVEAPAGRRMGQAAALRARRRDGSEVDVDIGLVPLDDGSASVVAFIRDISPMARLVERLDATNALFRTALAGAGRDDLERLIVDLTLRVVDATTCWFARSQPGGDSAEIVAAAGEDAEPWLGQRVRAAGVAGPGENVWVADAARLTDEPHPSGSVLAAPVRLDAGSGLIGAQRGGGPVFDAADRDALGAFADACSVALELVSLREQMVDLAAIEEHDRIARDLHDSVIQRLFATTMRLESAVPSLRGPAAGRVSEAVDELDGVIRDVRTAIFNLRRPAAARTGLRAAVADEVDRFAQTLGFAPSVRFEGLVDGAVSGDVAAAVPVVVREALANIARHAHARRADVGVEIDGDEIVVSVTDDGVGLPAGHGGGGGLANLASRAGELGGSFEAAGGDRGGTQITWRVPFRRDR